MLRAAFEGHSLTIIAADSIEVEPKVVTRLDINAGQRYDVLLAATQPPGSVWWVDASSRYRGSTDGQAVA
jgi:FtsP/CotA-like multicopper oxidase with cupredoxin domain